MNKKNKDENKVRYPDLVFTTPEIFRNLCSRINQDEHDAILAFYQECKDKGLNRMDKFTLTWFHRLIWSYIINEVGSEKLATYGLNQANRWYNAHVGVSDTPIEE